MTDEYERLKESFKADIIVRDSEDAIDELRAALAEYKALIRIPINGVSMRELRPKTAAGIEAGIEAVMDALARGAV